MYQTEPDPGLNGRRLRYPRGKVLGGCSSINGMIYMRGQARDYDSWAEIAGDPEWSWERALPDFVAHESHWRMAAGPTPEFARFHGASGEMRVEKQRAALGRSSTPSPTPASRPASRRAPTSTTATTRGSDTSR